MRIVLTIDVEPNAKLQNTLDDYCVDLPTWLAGGVENELCEQDAKHHVSITSVTVDRPVVAHA